MRRHRAGKPARANSVGSTRWVPKVARLTLSLVLLVVIADVPKLAGQGTDEFDAYKLRLGSLWVYSTPRSSLQGSADSGSIDLEKDLHFQTYSTFFGKLDWKFTHKSHFYVFGTRLHSSNETVFKRTITFTGNTFEPGLTTHSSLDSPAYGLGYQYDVSQLSINEEAASQEVRCGI